MLISSTSFPHIHYIMNYFQIITSMAPILYCTCSNCSCMATVLLTQKMDKVEGEANKVEEIEFENNKTSNCDDAGRRKEYFVENQNEESQTSEIVDKIVILAGGALLLLGKDYYLLVISRWSTHTHSQTSTCRVYGRLPKVGQSVKAR